MGVKSDRQAKIIEIISNQDIETQEQLLQELHQAGFASTQATISRDIKELGLVKVASADNTFRYGFPPGMSSVNTFDRAKKMMRDNLLKVEVGHNIIVLKALPGTAQGIAFCVDGLNWKEIIGCIAGDDTIFLVVRDEHDPREAAEKIRAMMA